MTLKNDVN